VQIHLINFLSLINKKKAFRV